MTLARFRVRRAQPDQTDQPVQPSEQAAPPAWPDGVVARYLTAAGRALHDPQIAVSVAHWSGNEYSVACAGCDYSRRGVFEEYGRERAQQHADACTGLPRPTEV